jgi:spore coat polysaccharide biosynthesis predicted glycosyltransferase SpsG
MGHLFRVLNLTKLMKRRGIPHVVFANNDPSVAEVLQRGKCPFDLFPLGRAAGWETAVIRKHRVTTWIDDRLDTERSHAEAVKACGVRLVTFDDRGPGAELADVHFAALAFDASEQLGGQLVCRGLEYLILDQAIERCRKHREKIEHVVLSLGGSDTYGITVRLVRFLVPKPWHVRVIMGPAFADEEALRAIVPPHFELKRNVPSLVEEFSAFDLAVTGGGMTPFEANAAGLPCIIVAAEQWEISSARYLASIGSSVFAGYRQSIDETIFDQNFDLSAMSLAGMRGIGTGGSDRVLSVLEQDHRIA